MNIGSTSDRSVTRHPKRWRSALFAVLRCLLVLLVALAIRVAAERRTESSDGTDYVADAATVAKLLPGAAEIVASGSGQEILDSNGQRLGYAMLSMPVAKSIIGYRGPSNVLLILDDDSRVIAAGLVSSEDTPEHVEAIRKNPAFFPQFLGWTLGEPGSFTQVDATTGATLTSLAVAEGIALRLGGEKLSLRFPEDLTVADLKLVYHDDAERSLRSISGVEAEVLDADGTVTGRLIRSGPLTDSIAGYQGPSEILMAMDADGRVTQMALRRTYDNQPYAGYLNEEPYFWKVFRNQSLAELQQLDLQAARVEGVSGATMTSMAVAKTVVAAAAEYERRKTAVVAEPRGGRIHWGTHDIGTIVVLLLAIVIGMTRLRGLKRVSRCWNVILVVYLGLTTGNLISLAVIMGWAARGTAWRLAPGLAAVIAVSFLLPATTRRNLYCSHICPHGAAQQLLRNRCKTSWKLSSGWARVLRFMPGVTLVAAVLVTLVGCEWNLAAWEPFHAYVWYVAGVSSIILAVGSLAASTVIPMAYCRYGCGTGRLLDYVRWNARSDRLTLADGIVAALACVSWVWASN